MSQVVPWKAFMYKIRQYFSRFTLIGRFLNKVQKATLTLSLLQQQAHTTGRIL